MTSFCFSWKPLFQRIKIPGSGIVNWHSPLNSHTQIWTFPIIHIYIHALLSLSPLLSLLHTRVHAHTHSHYIVCVYSVPYIKCTCILTVTCYMRCVVFHLRHCQHGKCNILHHFSLWVFSLVVVSCFSPQAPPRVDVHPALHQKLCMRRSWQLPPGFCPSQSSVCSLRTGAWHSSPGFPTRTITGPSEWHLCRSLFKSLSCTHELGSQKKGWPVPLRPCKWTSQHYHECRSMLSSLWVRFLL